MESLEPSWKEQGKHSAYGEPETLIEKIRTTLQEAKRFIGHISHNSFTPTYSFQMRYRCSATEEMIRAVVYNADAVATQLEKRVKD